ncbi:MAG TPA: phosphatidylserine decarboxylase [Victivallales bacterium]|nr:phosphatidylserine decarboxylase [Victivallales bacterium]
MTLTKYGIKEWLGTGIIAFIIIMISVALAGIFSLYFFYIIAFIVFIIWVAIAAFFRSPIRIIPENSELLISPADGLVKDIEVLDDCDYSSYFDNKPVLRIGIFLSVLNVHLNRAPCDLKVIDIIYKKGKYYDARDDRAGKENESNIIIGEANAANISFPIGIRQVSGAIARRIVCATQISDSLKKGEKYGMIKFGSRTEVYLPYNDEIKISVNVGDKITAGTSIIAEIVK